MSIPIVDSTMSYDEQNNINDNKEDDFLVISELLKFDSHTFNGFVIERKVPNEKYILKTPVLYLNSQYELVLEYTSSKLSDVIYFMINFYDNHKMVNTEIFSFKIFELLRLVNPNETYYHRRNNNSYYVPNSIFDKMELLKNKIEDNNKTFLETINKIKNYK